MKSCLFSQDGSFVHIKGRFGKKIQIQAKIWGGGVYSFYDFFEREYGHPKKNVYKFCNPSLNCQHKEADVTNELLF